MTPLTTERPWGNFRQFTDNEKTTVKILTVNPGQAFSLQYHEHRQEFWKVISGDPEVQVGKQITKAQQGDEFIVLPKELHRIKAGALPAVVLEVAYGDFKEEDIVRVEDQYGRV